MVDDYSDKPPALRVADNGAAGTRPGAGEFAEGRDLDIVEVAGAIKWFDVARGYGFIIPDNGGPDILLHVSALKRDGFLTAIEGARVVVEAVARQRGLQVFRVISMDNSTAVHPAQMPPPRTHVVVTPSSGLERMTVKWFNRLRGFGFASKGEGAPDIFLHMETLRRYGITDLKPGQEILVRYGNGSKGLMAAEVRLADGNAPQPSH
ncbi:MAG: cold-shock protein [Beijerinckiaceae bacterium]